MRARELATQTSAAPSYSQHKNADLTKRVSSVIPGTYFNSLPLPILAQDYEESINYENSILIGEDKSTFLMAKTNRSSYFYIYIWKTIVSQIFPLNFKKQVKKKLYIIQKHNSLGILLRVFGFVCLFFLIKDLKPPL